MYPYIRMSFPFRFAISNSSMDMYLPPEFLIFSSDFSEKDQAALETFFVSVPVDNTLPGIRAVSFSWMYLLILSRLTSGHYFYDFSSLLAISFQICTAV